MVFQPPSPIRAYAMCLTTEVRSLKVEHIHLSGRKSVSQQTYQQKSISLPQVVTVLQYLVNFNFNCFKRSNSTALNAQIVLL